MPDKHNSQSSPPLADNGENRSFYIGLAAAIIMICLLGLPLLQGRIHAKADLSRYHLPFRFFYAQSLAAGDSFLWLPNIFCGFYIHGEGQVGMYHPLHLMLYRLFPLDKAFNIEMLLSYPLMLIGMCLFLRRWNIRRGAMMLGAFVFTFSGFNLLHYMHMNAIAVVAHIPWILLAIDIVMSEETSSSKVAFVGLGITFLTASQLLLGHPTTFWLSSVLEVSYVLLLILSRGGAPKLPLLGMAKMLGILIGCIQLLPHWDVATDSIRHNASLEYLYTPSVHPVHLTQVVAPYFFKNLIYEGFPHELKIYNGIIPLTLLVWFLIRRKHLGKLRPLALGALTLIPLSLVLALGKYGYIFRLQTFLPFVGMLRTPCRYILLFHFATAIIAAVAFADLSEFAQRGDRTEWRELWPLALLPIASILPILLSLWFRHHLHPVFTRYFVGDIMPNDFVLVGPILFIMAAVIIAMASRGKKYVLAVIILFATIDLGAYGLEYIWRYPPVSVETLLDSLEDPPNSQRHRIESDNNLFLMKGINLSDGYVSIEPKKHLERLSEARLRLANVSWIWPKTRVHLLMRIPRERVAHPLPRGRLVSKTLMSSDPEKDTKKIDLVSTALVEKVIDLPEGEAGIATIIKERPGRIEVSTEAASRQLLVLSESYHAGWQATIDGTQTEVLRVYGDFMGCVIEAGNHNVEFTFRPKSFRVGAWLSALGLGLTLIFPFFLIYGISKKDKLM